MGPVILTGGMKNFDARKMFLTPTVVSSFLALVMTLLRLRPPRWWENAWNLWAT